MFLYLSKLLPLFFYPLGLASVSLVVALITVWKQPRTATAAIAFSLSLLLLCSNAWVAKALVRSLEWQNLPSQQMPNAEAIIVLGGATKSAFFPRPDVDLSEQGDRIIYAAQLYRQKKAPVIIVSGGRIDWRNGGTPESTDIASILTEIGVPSQAIIEEPLSLNTYQNAVNVKKILQSRGIHKVLLVTSAMHMPRSLKIFRRQSIDAIPAPTDFLVTQGELQELGSTPKAALLNLLPNTDNLHQFTNALKEYIGNLIYGLRGWL
ncbi:hypothetical protein NIES21_56190 [Anabaenopsis circularis NIES-21]|uniref:DUF218 domain-containing protein n=1 Tax=Anabaenopsis circularis NIES-21 TaxID=1085406 RepID=A0A1Z4GQH6_9CYAN|nr:hypothetical protein NIES21_56190 [Anabaenopsis circularis NIES-21]